MQSCYTVCGLWPLRLCRVQIGQWYLIFQEVSILTEFLKIVLHLII